jgi:hypothetical protein
MHSPSARHCQWVTRAIKRFLGGSVTNIHHFTRVDFHRFKAFKSFSLHLRHFNVLVGPNNSGKSTILAAFRILAGAMRKANSRNPQPVPGPNGNTLGHDIDLRSLSIAEENIFYNYDDSEPASIEFFISNRNKLILYFPETGACYLILETQGKSVRNPSTFKTQFKCQIGFVPILGPVEHNEPLYEKDAARLALYNYRAARNFRNIWHHYPDRFEEFQYLLSRTWPNMEIEEPQVDLSHGKPLIHMFCVEDRRLRELFWCGFGFQVWCQMLTHLIQSKEKSTFLIDEPDIYLHADLQRQLVGLLRSLGPDILVATHSTEIISEAEPDDIILINKKKQSAKRLKTPSQLIDIFSALGSIINPTLTQLAKTRRVVFVEGNDFQVVSKFAGKLHVSGVANRSLFAVVASEGFNPDKIRTLKAGMEATIGGVRAIAILDRDFSSDEECRHVIQEIESVCDHVIIHNCKEIENYLLVPAAIDRAATRRIMDQARRTCKSLTYQSSAADMLRELAEEEKAHIISQYIYFRKQFEKKQKTGRHESKIMQSALKEIECLWRSEDDRLRVLPGKKALAHINGVLQERYSVNVTPTSIIDAMMVDEVPQEMRRIISCIADWSDNAAPTG